MLLNVFALIEIPIIMVTFLLLSINFPVGLPSRTSYAASKFAVQGYCESLRAELATSGVSVHVASPGYIRTNLSMSAITGDGEAYGKMDDTTANGTCKTEFRSCTLVRFCLF